ncbi:MAG TPA: S-layer homology domain-containing protein [Fimbriimonas sp.]|nr:S-layer homology domain-containing protein [Fimbriimonas sp.]
MFASCACLFVVVVTGQNPRSFPDNAKNHWAYEGISFLKSQGILVGYPDSPGFRHPPPDIQSPYEFAVAYHAAYSNLLTMEDELRKEFDRISRAEPGSQQADLDLKEAKEELRKMKDPAFRKAVGSIERATKEFDRELRSLGVDVESMKLYEQSARSFIGSAQVPEPGASFKQFPDVPANHWAAKAVRALRSEGILHGYPDGPFR